MKSKKWISLLLIISLMNLVIPLQSLASEKGLFLSEKVAKQLLTDVTYYKINIPILEENLSICEQSLNLEKQQTEILNTKTKALEQDKADLTAVSEDFKTQLINKNNELIKSEESKPSRLVWFGAGFVSTIVLGVLGLILIK